MRKQIVKTRLALTLLELIAVLCILVALSGIAIPVCSDQLTVARQTATRSTLVEVQRAIQQYWHDTKLVPLDGVNSVATESQRFELVWLFRNPVTNDTQSQFNPNTRSGWNGPYLSSSTALLAGPNLIDAWNSLFEVQYVNPAQDVKDVRIVSAGPNGVVQIPANTASSLLGPSNIGDDLYVAMALR